MKWTKLALGIGVGIVGGYLLTRRDNKYVSAEEALHTVKKMLSDKGNIVGSWIQTFPENIYKNDITYPVYRGGVSIKNEEQESHYEFLSDAHTGTIIELQKPME